MAEDLFQREGSTALPSGVDNILPNQLEWGMWRGKPALRLTVNDNSITVMQTVEALDKIVEGLQKFRDHPRVQALKFQEAVKDG